MSKIITIRLNEEELIMFNGIEGDKPKDKLLGMMKKNSSAPALDKDIEVLLDKLVKEAGDSPDVVIGNAIKEYSRRFKRIEGIVYGFDELVEGFNLNPLDKKVQSRAFLDNIEIRLYE